MNDCKIYEEIIVPIKIADYCIFFVFYITLTFVLPLDIFWLIILDRIGPESMPLFFLTRHAGLAFFESLGFSWIFKL